VDCLIVITPVLKDQKIEQKEDKKIVSLFSPQHIKAQF